jgi:hypothetical protein
VNNVLNLDSGVAGFEQEQMTQTKRAVTPTKNSFRFKCMAR